MEAGRARRRACDRRRECDRRCAVKTQGQSRTGRGARLAPYSVVAIGAEGDVSAAVGVGAPVHALAVGFGSIWAAEPEVDILVRINPRTHRVVQTVPLPGTPVAVTTGLGAVWVASSPPGVLTEIDPATDLARRAVGVGASPAAVTVADGAVWVTEQRPATFGGRLVRFDPAAGTKKRPSSAVTPREWRRPPGACGSARARQRR